MSWEVWNRTPPCARCGCPRYFSVLCLDCIETVTLTDILDYERIATCEPS